MMRNPLHCSIQSFLSRPITTPVLKHIRANDLALAGCTTGLLLLSMAAPAQKITKDKPVSGDAPTVALPIQRDLSPRFSKKDVAKALRKVADHELEWAQPHFGRDWTYAPLYLGFLALPPGVGGTKYRDAVLELGKQFDWQPGDRTEHADDQAVSQAYLELYLKFHDPAMLQPTEQRMNAELATPDQPDKPLWWWCDALFMAPPVLAELSKATGETKYIDFMDREWWITYQALYDPSEQLYFRDASYLHRTEANGRPLFWARGNGWAIAGTARVLEYMPQDYPAREKYIHEFRQMAEKLASIQNKDGLWTTGLLDAQAYQGPENSGSALITYALAYGVRAGILDRKIYMPVIKRSWSGLLNHVYSDGRLGSIQPVGKAPAAFSPTSSYVYGVGAFLLAGSQIYALSR